MVSKKNGQVSKEILDRIGRKVVRTAAANEAEAEAAGSSHFLYARLRARIAAERMRREEGEGWLALLGVVWRAVPAMVMVAIFALVLFWSTASFESSSPPPGNFSDEAIMGARDAGIERVVFTDRRALSSDEILATILNEDEMEITR